MIAPFSSPSEKVSVRPPGHLTGIWVSSPTPAPTFALSSASEGPTRRARPPRQGEPRQSLLVDIDMERLFDGEGETGDLMVEMRCPDAEAGLIPELPREWARRQVLAPEGLFAGKVRPSDPVGIDLKDLETQGVALDKVPGVASQLSLHVADDPRGPEEAQDAIATQDRSEEVIETDEVIEVGMRDEDLAHP